MSIREITKISICVAILCVSAYISIPLPFTPVVLTALTISVNLVGLILSPNQALYSLIIYVLLGAVGMPVFAGGSSGIGVIFGPTGGFIIGFIVAAPLISLLKGHENNIKRYILVTIVIGMPVIYIGGAISMMYVLKLGLLKTLSVSVLPFILGDLLKCVISSSIAVRLNKVMLNNTINI